MILNAMMNSHSEKLTGTVVSSVVLAVFVAVVDGFVSLVVAVVLDSFSNSVVLSLAAVVAAVAADNMRIGEAWKDEPDRVDVDSLLHQNHEVGIAVQTDVNWFGRRLLSQKPDLAWHNTAYLVVENRDIRSSAACFLVDQGAAVAAAALEHTYQEVAYHTFDSSLLPFSDPFGKAVGWANALAAATTPGNGLASLPHYIVGIVAVARFASVD